MPEPRPLLLVLRCSGGKILIRLFPESDCIVIVRALAIIGTVVHLRGKAAQGNPTMDWIKPLAERR